MLSQIIAVTSVNLRSIGQRLGSSGVAIIGIAGVIVVFLGVQAAWFVHMTPSKTDQS